MASLNFKGKSAVWNHHLSVPYHTFEKDKKSSLSGQSENENLLIEGDNLLALKALLPKYQGKIKCIYIDPPYNTGNEGWVYNDNVNNPIIKSWLGETVGKEGEDLSRHDKWLCMMTPRLKLLQELLADEGIIFVSIDENEVHHLKCLMNEIFGAENFIAELPTIMNLKGNQDEFGFAGTHEYTLVYAKIKNEKLILNDFILDEEEAEDWQEDDIGFFKKGANLKSTGTNAPREKRPNLYFPLYISKNNELSIERQSKNDIEIYPITDGKEMSWRWGKDKFIREPYNIIISGEGSNISIYKKQRPSLGDLPSKKPKSLFYKPEYSSGNGTAQLKNLFGKKIFDNPKPVDLIKDFLNIAGNKDAIILDSFAGSGTTAQAVLELNKEDGEEGKRKFILIQLPETLSEKAQAKSAGYDYVHEITRDRIKKVISRDKLEVGFTYYKLGSPIDGKSLLSGKDLPTWDSFAKYAHYLATGKPIEEVKKPKESWEIISGTKGTGIYLIYKDKIEDLKNLAITRDWLESIKDKKGKKIVYAPACFLDKEVLDEYEISFVQIPFNLFSRS